jgi:hypothetical protein
VMSLFTSLAMSIAFFLAFMERQWRYNRALAQEPPGATPPSAAPAPSKTA